MTPALEVIEPGLLTTVQDAGRPGFGHLGVPRSGACDELSLAGANLLLGNEPTAAALELTFGGASIGALRECVVGLAGADLGGRLDGSSRRLEPGHAHRLRAGDTLVLPGPPPSAAAVRAYLALPGGVDVPVVLGSRSTCLVAGFGGFEGRPLRSGDRIAAGRDANDAPVGVTWTGSSASGPIRVVAGRDPGLLEPLLASDWTVSPTSDRVGLRLEGPTEETPAAGGRRSHGVVPGTIQLPPDGHPIVLLADGPATGGYPVPAVVITADLWRLGQLGPGATISFRVVTPARARDLRAAWRDELAAGISHDSGDADWDELWRSARG